VGTIALVAAPGALFAAIAAPQTLESLVGESDVIAIGHVEQDSGIRYMMPGLWLSAIVVLAIGLLWAWRHRARKLAVGILAALLLLGIIVLVVQELQTRWHLYSRMATLTPEQFLKGHAGSEILIMYGDGFPCDTTRFHSGRRYVLFLREEGRHHVLSWYQYSQLEVNDGLVSATWGIGGTMELEKLSERVQKVIR
jgi:hypothetical protein